MSSMSLSSIDWKPRMLEPSNPSPSLKLSISSSPRGRLKCCHVPGRSTKRTSTTSTPSACARSSPSRGLVLPAAFVSTAMNTLHENEDLTGRTLIVGTCQATNQVRLSQTDAAAFCAVDTKRTCPQARPPCVKATSSRPPISQVHTFLRPAGRSYAVPIKRCGCSPPRGKHNGGGVLVCSYGSSESAHQTPARVWHCGRDRVARRPRADRGPGGRHHRDLGGRVGGRHGLGHPGRGFRAVH